MNIEDVLRILKNGAEKPKDDLNDYTKGKRDGQVQAYSHAWTLVKNLYVSGVVEQSEQLKPTSQNMEECDMCGQVNELGYDKCKGCSL